MKKTKPAANAQPDELDLIDASLVRYRPYLSDTAYEALVSEITKSIHTAIRVNCLKADPNTIIHDWQTLYDWDLRQVPFYPHGWQVLNADRSISQTIEHRMGIYYMQDAASMLPVAMYDIDPKPGQLILDMAASPGGKTTQLMDLFQDQSLVLANDSSKSRMQALRVVLQNWGAANYFTTNFAGEKLGDWFPEMFDVILLDAPCSMENLRPTPTHPLRSTTDSERSRLSMRQGNLILSAFKALKPGGQLVYSTCTLAPEEDEAVLDLLMRTYPNQAHISPINKWNFDAPGFTEFQGIHYHPGVKNALRLWPNILETSGFFAARIEKNDALNVCAQIPPQREFSAAGLIEATSDKLYSIQAFLLEMYGFNLIHLLEKYQLALLQREQTFFLIPQGYLENFQTIPFHTLGMILGKYGGSQLTLSHEFVSRFAHNFLSGFLTIDEEQVDVWLSGRDLRNLSVPEAKLGSIAVIKDLRGRILGSGKVLTERIRNLLPPRLV